jgi:amino acid permease
MTSFMSICYLSIAIVIEYFVQTGDTNSNFADAPPARANAYSIFVCVPTIVFAYTCHPNVLPIYVELRKRNTRHMTKILVIGLTIVMFCYMLVGVFGFLTFYDDYGMISFPGEVLAASYG